MTPPTAATTAVLTAECPECSAAIEARATLQGEILDCPDCGVELEVRSVSPLVLQPAPEVEEDWGE